MRPEWRFRLICAALAAGGLALSIYAALTPASALMMPESKETRRAVLKRIPVGTSAEAARATMEREGFACVQVDDQPFSVSDPDSGAPVSHAATDVLRCDSGRHGFLITKRWRAMLIDRGGPVSAVAVSTDMGGP